MSTGNTIQGTFGMDLAPLRRDWSEAERMARTEGARVAQATQQASAAATRGVGASVPYSRSNATAPFGVDYEARAREERRRRNSAGGFRPAPSGKYLIDEPEVPVGRRGGGAQNLQGGPFGIIGAMTAVYGVQRLVNAYKEMNDAAISVRDRTAEIGRIAGTGSFRGVAEIRTNLRAAADTLAEMRQQTIVETQKGGSLFNRILGGSVRGVRQILTGDTDANEQERTASLRAAASRDISALGAQQERLNQAARERLNISEHQAELTRIEVENITNLLELSELESRTGAENPAARNAEMERYRIAVESENRRHDLLSQQLGLAERLEEINASGLTTDEKRLRVLRERMTAANTRQFNAGSEEEKRAASVEAAAAERELGDEQFRQYEANRGPRAGFEYRQGQRREQRLRRNFEANKADYLGRQGRGAYNQTGPLADILGPAEAPTSGPGASNMPLTEGTGRSIAKSLETLATEVKTA